MSEMTSEKELNVSTEKNTDKISESDQQSELKTDDGRLYCRS